MKLDDGDNLEFEFHNFLTAEKFDVKGSNPRGLLPVDFLAETSENLYFIEVKNYQNPKATEQRKIADFHMLASALEEKNKSEPKMKSTFVVDMGQKIKDSLLRQYALKKTPDKPIIYLLFINLDKFGENELLKLKTKISGYIPTGLNAEKYNGFTKISFDVVNSKKLKEHGIICTQITN
jgi:hypothetical protein